MPRSPISVALACLTTSASLWAGPLQEARINQIVNDVKVIAPQAGARPARLQDLITGDLGVHTGVQSRAELLFQDQTLTRLGAETFFSFKPGTRDINLERGTLLLQVPKDRGGARIRAASVTASITGTTIMMEHLPSKSLKIVVLEGSLRVGIGGRVGETLLLTPGKMVIMDPAARRVPEPVTVDLRKLMKTSTLVDPKAFAGKTRARVATLPSVNLIEQEIGRQEKQFQKKTLVATNLVIAGNGTEVIAASEENLARIEQGSLRLAEANAATSNTAPASGVAPAATGTAAPPAASVGAVGEQARAATRSPEPATLPVAAASSPASASKATESVKQAQEVNQIKEVLTAIAEVLATGENAPNSTAAANANENANGIKPNNTAAVGGDANANSNAGTGSGNSNPGQGSTPDKPVLTPIDLAIDAALPSLDPTGARPFTLGDDSDDGDEELSGLAGSVQVAPGAGAKLRITGPTVDLGGDDFSGLDVSGGSALLSPGRGGGDGGTVIIGTPAQPISGGVKIDAPVLASTGKNSSGVATGGRGGAVQIVARGGVVLNSRIEVSSNSNERRSAQGGTIAVSGDKGIQVTDSGQLLSLLNAGAPGPGGTIKFISTRGNIKVSGGQIQADRGTVELGVLGEAAAIGLTNAQIAGDVVKIGAVGAKGQLVIGGGNISADTMLKLYGGSTNGRVRFTADTTLGGAGAKLISGRTVTIDNNRTVTVGGSQAARVFTDRPNYTGSGGNGSTSGRFGGAGAVTKPFADTPAF